MPIIIKNPVTLPETTLDKMWASEIHILADFKTQHVQAVVRLFPYNDNGETATDKKQSLVVDDLLAKIKDAPQGNLAHAYGALIAAIQEEYDLQNG